MPKKTVRLNFSESDPEKQLLLKLLQNPEIQIEEAVGELGWLVGRDFGELAPQNFEEAKLYLSKQLEGEGKMDSARGLEIIKNFAGLESGKVEEISRTWHSYDLTVLGWVISEYYDFENSLLKKYEAKKTNDLRKTMNLKVVQNPVRMIPRPEEVVETVMIERRVDESYTRKFPYKRLKERAFGYLCGKLGAGPYTAKRSAVKSGLKKLLEKNF